jgi:membrane protease YdiL (CAAX protease family)
MSPGATGRRRAEVLLVLGLSLGQSAVYAVVSLVATLTEGPLSQATATLNASRSPRPWLDLTYQLLAMGFALVPVALALFLLSEPGRSALRRTGLDLTRPGRDLALGAGLAAVVGVPGLALYLAGRALGVTATIVPAALDRHWWTIPVLVLSALQNAVLEEVVAVGYLVERLEELRWGWAAVVVASALLRGAYHLYQGFGPFLGNAVMGVLFVLVYRRTRRVTPLVVAHTLLDVVAFVGYDLVGEDLGF